MKPNLSNITSSNIRAFLVSHPYISPGRIEASIERTFVETMTMSDLFYAMCNYGKTPPAQHRYSAFFLNLCYSELVAKGINPIEFGKRVRRAWASLVMELDFMCQLRDSGYFETVSLDTDEDTKCGYDLRIGYQGKTYPIHLAFRTQSEIIWVKEKARRKENVEKPIDFPLIPTDSEEIGNLHLYKKSDVERLRKYIIGDGEIQVSTKNNELQKWMER